VSSSRSWIRPTATWELTSLMTDADANVNRFDSTTPAKINKITMTTLRSGIFIFPLLLVSREAALASLTSDGPIWNLPPWLLRAEDCGYIYASDWWLE
jgi:hypothetical protein